MRRGEKTIEQENTNSSCTETSRKPVHAHHSLHSNCCVDEICLYAPPLPRLLTIGVLDFRLFSCRLRRRRREPSLQPHCWYVRNNAANRRLIRTEGPVRCTTHHAHALAVIYENERRCVTSDYMSLLVFLEMRTRA